MEDVAAEACETIIFLLPSGADVERLFKRIRPRWPGAIVEDDDVCFVTADVALDGTDLALLLREVEAGLSDSGLRSVRYCLDGRFYVMKRPRLANDVSAHRLVPPRHTA